MKTIVLEKNPDGNVVLSVDQIRKMLDDAYDEGYRDGKAADKVSITYPSYPPMWYNTTTETDKVSLDKANVMFYVTPNDDDGK